MLTTFTPSVGPKAGRIYTLPPLLDSDKRASHVNRMQNAYQELEEESGVYLSAGANPLFPSFAEIQAVFEMSQAWLLAQGYSASFAGLETALSDFAQYVIAGGLGTLVDKLPDGTKSGLGGEAISHRSASAVVNGDYNPERKAGQPVADITLVFMLPDASWTLSNGLVIPAI
ncbi:MAG: hypothetical protein ACRDFS_03515 [Chloroflexota bacterium]